MTFTKIGTRPPRARRLANPTADDLELENALMHTYNDGAIIVPLAFFHSSPAKGRLWKNGYALKHRVLADRQNVAAWVESGVAPMAPNADTH
jgi:hypothetical protein